MGSVAPNKKATGLCLEEALHPGILLFKCMFHLSLAKHYNCVNELISCVVTKVY